MIYENFKQCEEIVRKIDTHTELLSDLKNLRGFQINNPDNQFSSRIDLGKFSCRVPEKYNDLTLDYLSAVVTALETEIDGYKKALAQL